MVVNIKVEGLSKLQNNLKSKVEKISGNTRFWDSMGMYIQRQTINERFGKEQSPKGAKWKPISEKTKENRRNKSEMKILQDTGELRRSVKYKASQNGVIVGTNLKYAAIHHFGGRIPVSSKMRKFLHYKGIHLRKGTKFITIPARPYLGLNVADRKHIINSFTAYLKRNGF